MVFFDIECYRNYFLVVFYDEKPIYFETYTHLSDAQINEIYKIIRNNTIVGFNSKYYDIPILFLALKGFITSKLKEASDELIVNKVKHWILLRNFGFLSQPKWDTIDAKELCPKLTTGESLKMFGGRVHTECLQDLPYDPSSEISQDMASNLLKYCINDCLITKDVFSVVKENLEVRCLLSQQYEMDLRSSSDSSMAEAVFRKILNIQKSDFYTLYEKNTKLSYEPYKGINFKLEKFKNVLEEIKLCSFIVEDYRLKGNTNILLDLDYVNFSIKQGGIHSNEKSCHFISNDNNIIVNVDVASYYPNLMVNYDIYPNQIGNNLTNLLKKFITDRLRAKKEGNKPVSDSLKILLNSIFGRLGYQYSIFFDIQKLINVTMTGQLLLLVLIERFFTNNIKIVSANTDGVVCNLPKEKLNDFKNICSNWEQEYNLTLEHTFIKKLYIRDVNNYFEIDSNNNFKGKGIFSSDTIRNTPFGRISVEAVVAYLLENKSIFDTINRCKDIKKFVFVKTVSGGGHWNGDYVGKVVRWYHSHNGFNIKTSKYYNVSCSELAKPLMTLPKELPYDLNINAYVLDAYNILKSLIID